MKFVKPGGEYRGRRSQCMLHVTFSFHRALSGDFESRAARRSSLSFVLFYLVELFAAPSHFLK